MKTPRKGVYLRVALLVGLVAVFGLIVTGRVPDEWLKPIRASLPGSTVIVGGEPELPPDPRLEAQARAPVAASPWQEAEKSRYTEALKRAAPDVVVIPYQIPSDKKNLGVDLTGRMVMAHIIADRIAAASRLKVADVELVSRALGEPRYLSRDEASAFARAIGAKELVYGLVQHDGKNRIAVKLVRLSPSSSSKEQVAAADSLPISDVSPPEVAFRSVADDLARRIGAATRDAKSFAMRDDFFPKDPLEKEGSNPVEGIWTQQLVAALHAPAAFRHKSRVFERTLAALDSIAPDAPDYRLLTARALVELNRRPAAIEALGAAKSPEELALLEYMNGNLPELTAAIAKIKRPLPKLLAQLDRLALERAYVLDSGEAEAAAESLARSVPAAWQPAVLWHAVMQSGWLVRSSMEMKLVLDAQFPIPGYSAEELLRGKSVAGSPDDPRVAYEVEAMAVHHAHKVIEQSGAAWCCRAGGWRPQPYQYLDLIAGLSESMLLQLVDRSNDIHGQPESALRAVDLLNQTLFHGGNVQLQYRAMNIHSELMRKERAPDKRVAHANRAYDAARQVRQWERADPGTIIRAVQVEREAAQVRNGEQGSATAYPDLNELKTDVPASYAVLVGSSAYRAALRGAGDVELFKRACNHALVQMRACFAWRSAYDINGDADNALKIEREQLLARFRGNPYLQDRLVTLMKRRGDLEGARTLARRSLETAPARFKGYSELGLIALQNGEFREAQKVFMSWPHFSRAGNANTVAISNNASWVANGFAMRGATSEARPFFEIAARYRNGSAASYSAAMNLAYAERRYGDAEAIALQAAQHYPGGGLTDDYIALLFALGDSRTGWATAREAMSRYSSFAPWFAVPVGFRVDGAKSETVRAWAKEASQLPARGSGNANGLYALTVALHALAVDRSAESLAEMSAARTDLFGKAPDLTNPASAAGNQGAATHLNALDRFISGYSAHKKGDFTAAGNVFRSWTHGGLTDPANDVLLTALPFHTYASVKTGRAQQVGPYLDMLTKAATYTSLDELSHPFPLFDFYLSRAILAAAAGDHAEARKQLVLAQSYGQPLASRPLPPAYVFGEICELLAADSGRREYLDMGVKLAKAYQSYEPWSAWAYAYEARHGTAAADRAKAYAIGRHLDRNSARLAAVEPEIVKQADQWLARNTPFPRDRSQGQARTL